MIWERHRHKVSCRGPSEVGVHGVIVGIGPVSVYTDRFNDIKVMSLSWHKEVNGQFFFSESTLLITCGVSIYSSQTIPWAVLHMENRATHTSR